MSSWVYTQQNCSFKNSGLVELSFPTLPKCFRVGTPNVSFFQILMNIMNEKVWLFLFRAGSRIFYVVIVGVVDLLLCIEHTCNVHSKNHCC